MEVGGEVGLEIPTGVGLSLERWQRKHENRCMNIMWIQTSAHLHTELMFELSAVWHRKSWEELEWAHWLAHGMPCLVKKQPLLFGVLAHAQGCYQVTWGILTLRRGYLSKHLFQLGNSKPEAVGSSPWRWAKIFTEQMQKQSKDVIWWVIASTPVLSGKA